MTTIAVSIEMLSYWHVGSGAGRGADVDALVLKDEVGLPYLPGRTLKGLLREGMRTCEDAGRVPAGTTDSLFGKHAAIGDPAGSTPGSLRVSDGRLPEAERAWLAAADNAESRAALFDTLASTRLDTNGLAEDHSLRAIELTVPIGLRAEIEGPEDNQWVERLGEAITLVRALGSHRTRGLGRCKMSFAGEVTHK